MVVLVDDNEVVPRVAADGGGFEELARQLALRTELGVVCSVGMEQLYAVVRSVRHHNLSVLGKGKQIISICCIKEDSGMDKFLLI